MRSTGTLTLKQKALRFFYGFLAIFLFFCGLGLFKYFQISKAMAEGAKMGPPPTAVSTVIAKKAPWTTVYKTAGTIRGEQSATLSTETAGRVSKVNVSEGQTVTAGTVVLELDSAVEEAEYQAGVAQRDMAEREYTRIKGLVAAKAVSQDEFDKSRLTYESYRAAADALKGRAERRRIVAPFNGTVGVIRVNLGDYVKEGVEVVAIENNENLYAVFSLNQKALLAIQNGLNKKPKILIDVIGLNKPFTSALNSIDPSINDFTKTALGKALVPAEAKNRIVGGMSVGIEIQLSEDSNTISIPTSSIAFAPFGDSVYLIEKAPSEDPNATGKVVKQTFIKVLESRGELTAVASGLQEGQEIVSSGTFKLFPGAPVIINNDIKPGESLRPETKNT